MVNLMLQDHGLKAIGIQRYLFAVSSSRALTVMWA